MFKRFYVWVSLLLALALAACGGEEEPAATLSPAADEGLVVGADAPAFTLPASDGSTVSLGDFAGKPVLLYFHMAVG